MTSTAERPVLFTSIPYEDGWEAYVDGKTTDIYPVMGDAFLALVLTPGEHTIELHYTAPGREIGMMLSEASGIILLVILLMSRIHLSRKGTSKENTPENPGKESLNE